MSYSVVPTVATGDVWTASNHNLYVRDNFRAVVPDVVTTKGQLVIGDGANALALLGVGNDNEILQGDLTWSLPRDFIYFCANSDISKSFVEGGSGNYQITANFDVPEGANWIYCSIELLRATSTAHWTLYPSYDTTVVGMRVDAHGDTVYSQCHGIMPLDSTGGLYYLATDTADAARLRVYAWMY